MALDHDTGRSDRLAAALASGVQGTGQVGRPRPTRPAVERFARALLDLLQCERCRLAMVSCEDGAVIEDVQVGCAPTVGDLSGMVARLPGHRGPQSQIQPLGPDDPVAVALLGREPADGSHSVTGRLVTDPGIDIVFLGGWRKMPLAEQDHALCMRALHVMWERMGSVGQTAAGFVSLRAVIDELAAPAFVVDQHLHLIGTNEIGRQLLLNAGPVKAHEGSLAGLTSSSTVRLKQAVQGYLLSQFERERTNTIVALSLDTKDYAFAWVGSLPTYAEMGHALVIIPQVEEVAAARWISTVFGLSWAEERIVARILQGQAPPNIGEALKLTEATVRTYTKRIMLKLGINRRSDLFRLALLMRSPFVTGPRDQAVSPQPPERPKAKRTPRSLVTERVGKMQKASGFQSVVKEVQPASNRRHP